MQLCNSLILLPPPLCVNHILQRFGVTLRLIAQVQVPTMSEVLPVVGFDSELLKLAGNLFSRLNFSLTEALENCSFDLIFRSYLSHEDVMPF